MGRGTPFEERRLRVLTLTNEQVLALANMKECAQEMNSAFITASHGKVDSPIRTRFMMSDVRNILLMPSLLRDRDTVSLKMVSVYADLGGKAPSTQAVVMLADGRDGEMKCIMGGTGLTGLRTGAVSGLSCRYLAREDSRDMAMIGAGGQGFYQISGVASQRGIRRVSIFDVERSRAITLKERCEKELGLGASTSESVREATDGADIIVTATTSKTPILDASQVKPGTHVVAIGAYTPDTRELTSELVSRASIYVDSMDAAMEEAGDLLIPIREGAITAQSVRGDMAGLVSGSVKGRSRGDEITLFKAVGLAFEDNAIARMVYSRALTTKVGAWIDL